VIQDKLPPSPVHWLQESGRLAQIIRMPGVKYSYHIFGPFLGALVLIDQA
jgi:hypothetical protein